MLSQEINFRIKEFLIGTPQNNYKNLIIQFTRMMVNLELENNIGFARCENAEYGMDYWDEIDPSDILLSCIGNNNKIYHMFKNYVKLNPEASIYYNYSCDEKSELMLNSLFFEKYIWRINPS